MQCFPRPRSSHLSFCTSALGQAAALALAFGCTSEPPARSPDDAPARFASAVCAAHDRCGCIEEIFDDEDACEREAAALFRGIEAEDWSGGFDEGCFERLLHELNDANCSVGPTGPSLFQCETFEGTIGRGESCPSIVEVGPPGFLTFGPCSGGRVCQAGHCVDPPLQVAALGEPCIMNDVNCRDSYCANDEICRPRPAAGQSCDLPTACDGPGLYCAGWTEQTAGECQATVSLGGPCDVEAFGACGFQNVYCSAHGTCQSPWPLVCLALAPAPGSISSFIFTQGR